MKDKLKCTILESKYFWLRYASTQNSLDKFDQIRLFLFGCITKRLYRIAFRFRAYELNIESDPFNNRTTITIGRRFFTYNRYEIKIEKSITRN